MRKFKALYINEMIKISRKLVVIIVMGVMVLGLFGYGGIIKLTELAQKRYDQVDMSGSEQDWRKDEMRNMLDNFKSEKANLQDEMDKADEEMKKQYESQIKSLDVQIEIYEYAVEKDIYLYSGGYTAVSLRNMMDLKFSLINYEGIPVEEMNDIQRAEKKRTEDEISKYEEIIEKSDYRMYIDFQNEIIDSDTSMTEEEKQIMRESNDLRVKIDPTGEISASSDYDPLSSYITSIENIKKSLLHNIDYTGYGSIKPLTPSGRQELENSLAVQIYKLEKGDFERSNNYMQVELSDVAMTGMLGFGTFMMICMVLILAGGAISQEISTGSIKSLIISPVKRYKIFFAKLTSIITAGVATAVVLYIVSILVHGILFGFGNGSDYIYAINGKAHELSFYIYRMAYIGLEFVDVLVYLVFAYMLSIITRNTAVSVGVSIAIYFGGNLVNLFLSATEIFSGEWLKFIPFNNMSLADRIFKVQMNNIGISGLFGLNLNAPSSMFSVVYLVVMLICFGYIALDSFNRRDIK
ncbi:MAG: ABC transporter permease subunit [Saccharofermentanales bacterium]